MLFIGLMVEADNSILRVRKAPADLTSCVPFEIKQKLGPITSLNTPYLQNSEKIIKTQ